MRSNLKRTFAVSAAAGALALAFVLGAPARDSRAAESARSAIGTTTTGAESPMEMQRRGGFRGHRFGHRGGHYRGRGWRGPGPWVGAGAAALIIGGAAAAAAASRGPYDCWVERRWVDGPWGPELRRVRVCD